MTGGSPVKLTNRQRSFLRGLGQRLRPALHVGHAGLTAATQEALEQLFAHRELVKARLLPSSPEGVREVAQAMSVASGAALVGVVGRTFVLYRPNPDLKQRLALDPAA